MTLSKITLGHMPAMNEPGGLLALARQRRTVQGQLNLTRGTVQKPALFTAAAGVLRQAAERVMVPCRRSPRACRRPSGTCTPSWGTTRGTASAGTCWRCCSGGHGILSCALLTQQQELLAACFREVCAQVGPYLTPQVCQVPLSPALWAGYAVCLAPSDRPAALIITSGCHAPGLSWACRPALAVCLQSSALPAVSDCS